MPVALFLPLRERSASLCRALDTRRVLPLAQAAAVLCVPEKQVARILDKCVRRGLFAPYHPYADDGLCLLVLDPQFAAHAELIAASTALRGQLAAALEALSRLHRDKPLDVGALLQKVVRGLLTPSVPAPAVQRCERALQSLSSVCGELVAASEAYPLAPGARETALAAHVLRRAVGDVYNGLLAGHVQQLSGEAELAFRRAAARFCANAAQPEDAQADGVRALDTQREALYTRALLLRTRAAKDAFIRINAQLLDLLQQLRALDLDVHSGALRSLRTVYLPMLRELLEKQLRYEQLPSPDAAAQQAMENSILVLEREIPAAFRALLDDLRETSAVDLEAHSEALRRKLQLDGLLDLQEGF